MFKDEYEYFDAILSDNYEKPVVHYSQLLGPVYIGERAVLVTVDHPASYLNDYPCVYTSGVVSYDEASGEIETRNTLYKPIKG